MTLLIIYLVGCVVAYGFTRWLIKKSTKIGVKYTVSDRRFNLLISIFSWATALVVGVIFILDWFIEYFMDYKNDTPAKW